MAVVDADLADALAAAGDLRDVAVQAYFGLSNERDSWLSLLAGLLARVRYEGQYRLKALAGLNCPLTGNGMCLGVGLLARAGWAADALTENWELYARYTALGERIRFAPTARLHSQEARTLRQSATQRVGGGKPAASAPCAHTGACWRPVGVAPRARSSMRLANLPRRALYSMPVLGSALRWRRRHSHPRAPVSSP